MMGKQEYRPHRDLRLSWCSLRWREPVGREYQSEDLQVSPPPRTPRQKKKNHQEAGTPSCLSVKEWIQLRVACSFCAAAASAASALVVLIISPSGHPSIRPSIRPSTHYSLIYFYFILFPLPLLVSLSWRRASPTAC